jgi:predicted ribosomally synthesized peptide with SipW-like signal peptide
MRRRRRAAVWAGLLFLGLVAGSTSGATLAAFNASTSNTGNTFSSKRIFPADRSTTGWAITDAASGTASDGSSLMAYTDGRYYLTKQWSAGSFNTDRWMEFDLNSPLPAGLSFGSATFTLVFSDDGGRGGEACFYFDTRKASDGSVISTHGSSGSPIGCESSTTMHTVSTPIPAVDTTNEANDLRIRAYMEQDQGDPLRIDKAIVTGTVYGKVVTLYPKLHRDRADGTTSTTPWGPATASDGANYQTSGNWSSAFSTSRYLSVRFPAYVPNAAVVTSASISHAYRSATSGDTTCWYLEVYNGATLIGTHGSSGTPISCNATTSFVTDNVSIPEVDTAPEANNVVIRIYAKVSGNRKTQHDLIGLTVDYSLAATGCTEPGGSVTLTATADSWVDQDKPTDTAGSDADIKVRSKTGSQNRRGLVSFDLPIPPDCSVTGATLRLFQNGSQGTRTIQVFRAASSWTEAGVNWNNMPATAGTAATASNGSGWITWSVTTLVQQLYSIANHGFILKDSSEGSATSYEQKYDTREATNAPELVITFG